MREGIEADLCSLPADTGPSKDVVYHGLVVAENKGGKCDICAGGRAVRGRTRRTCDSPQRLRAVQREQPFRGRGVRPRVRFPASDPDREGGPSWWTDSHPGSRRLSAPHESILLVAERACATSMQRVGEGDLVDEWTRKNTGIRWESRSGPRRPPLGPLLRHWLAYLVLISPILLFI